MRIGFAAATILSLFATFSSGCGHGPAAEVITVYCAVDQPYARPIFEEFTKETGIEVAVLYDIESSKSVGLAGRLEAERNRPHCDVWWGSEAFLTTRLAEEKVLEPYAPPTAADISAEYKDPQGYWTGVGLRARVLAVGDPPPPFPIRGLADLIDPRLKGKIAISVPTAGATGAHVAALYVVWGPEKAAAFFHKLHDNGVTMLGGNAEVADQVGGGAFQLGLTDSDDVTNTAANGMKITAVVPDQDGEGTLAMPTTVALVAGTQHAAAAKKLIDFLASKQCEDKLLEMKFARWSVRGGSGGLKSMKVDYRAAAKIFPRAMRESMEILQGR